MEVFRLFFSFVKHLIQEKVKEKIFVFFSALFKNSHALVHNLNLLMPSESLKDIVNSHRWVYEQ